METMKALPLEVVQCISEKFSLRKWARTSGTCKEWWTMPLNIIDLSGGFLSSEGLPSAGELQSHLTTSYEYVVLSVCLKRISEVQVP